MNNDIKALNNNLFEQIERLQSAETSEEVELEVNRSKAINEISKTIISAGTLSIHAQKMACEYGYSIEKENPLLGIKEDV